ncbi:putative bifunctional diguanylate cyclase/phosphodiesterase [Novosphingobium sp. Rr 2-17]|uniref:putative bifunctional diguanylate cyclase/phosphodiesterase n=1 Tax=Novosphingobium sp. Rr 2-17 TaxID=555793 RepID=UPI001ED9501B|nr:EAL domain-containing protein [Novosphingobium sp. Rr 2-17]
MFFGGIGALVLAIRRAADLAREIREREIAEAHALSLARHDPLTGLANRRVLQDELPALLEEARSSTSQCVVFVIDLDHFKPINDVYGHDTGDAVLVKVASRLQRVVGARGLVARVGGDEFVLAMLQEPGTDAPSRTAIQVIRALSAPYEVGGRLLELGATVGIARAPVDATLGDDLLRVADVAMYDGKRAGKGTHRFFHADMDQRLRARAMLEAELREAITTGDITPYFQPVIALCDDRIIGFEALARWHHPTRGTIPPDEFIPIAEDLGLIDALSQRILRQGCIAASDWHWDTTLSINISPVQLKDSWLAAKFLAILQETGFNPQRLIVEVSENAITDDIQHAAIVLASLQNVGIRVALDDFGKGYSSFSHLRELKFDYLKIDSSFVESMNTAESRKIVSAVAGLGKALGMPVTAEGVESAEVADALRELGCEHAQGFLFGRPVAAIEAAGMVRSYDDRAELLKRSAR